MNREIFVVGGARTPIGSFGGTLCDISLAKLGALVMRAALERAKVPPDAIEHVVIGNVIPTDPRDAFLSRVVAMDSGIPKEVPAFNVNRLCGSGLQAIVSAAQSIMLGDAGIAVAGGAESMSRAPYIIPSARSGARMGDATMVDYMFGVLRDPWGGFHMGITAENVARRYQITREMQDKLAYESQLRAANAINCGYFKEQIVSVPIEKKGATTLFDRDEHVRPNVTRESLAAMKPAFDEQGTVTAGNSSGINDGAAAVILADERQVGIHALTPLARLVGYAHAGVEPAYMGIGPIPASKLVLKKTGLSVRDLDVIESNEAFAAQACAVTRELDLDPDKVNPNGSGISLGHPVGATGAIITLKAIYELHRVQGRYALVTMCIGGGQGIAAIFERV